MSEILQHAFAMPTAVFTVLLGLVVVYWGAALAGFFSFEMFHSLEHLVGIGDAAHSVGHAIDSIDSVGHAVDSLDGGHIGFFDKLGLHSVPRPISWSLTTFFSWAISLATSIYVPGYDTLVTRGLLVVAGIGVGCLVLATGLTAVAIIPLRKAMEAGYGQTRSDLVGKSCVVRTGRVDETFGQAEVEGGSALVQVRQRRAGEHDFHLGSQAVIDEYDAGREVFYIRPQEAEEAARSTT